MRTEILALGFAILGLCGVAFWLVMFRLWITRRRGLGLGRILIEGMGVLVAFLLAGMIAQGVSLIWFGEPVGVFTRIGVVLTVGVFSWFQVIRFTTWWFGRIPKVET